MKLSNLPNLLTRDFKIVEHKKVLFLIPCGIIVLALIMGIIFGVVKGSPFNLGMDFTGGYTMNVKLSTKLNDSTYDDYTKKIDKIFKDLTDESGNSYNLKLPSYQRQGNTPEDAAIYIKYQSIKIDGFSDEETQSIMSEEVNVKLREKLVELIMIAPESVKYEDGKVIATYPDLVSDPILGDISQLIKTFATKNSITITGDITTDETKRILTFAASSGVADKLTELKDAMALEDMASGNVSQGDMIAATISGELLTNTLLAVALALALMLIYIAFRFEVSSGASAILALVHDLIMVFAFMTIFHIEINATFIAAIITVLGYSINNTIIIFDRIRELFKQSKQTNTYLSPTFIANNSVKETIIRTINTTITTLLAIGMVAIIGVSSVRVFALPIIVGLIAGTYSSICISPSIWAMWKTYLEKREKEPKKVKSQKKAV